MSRTPTDAPPKGSPHRVRQAAERGQYDHDSIHAVLDACVIGHVAIALDGRAVSIPTAIARIGEHLYLHGSTKSRLFMHMASGAEISVSCAVVDGLVKARSQMHCSMNYRSAVVHGRGEVVGGMDKAGLLDAFTEHLIPGSAGDYRDHLPKELKATLLIRVPLDQTSVKVRSGGPNDDAEDLGLPHWAGVIPIAQHCAAPEAAEGVPAGATPPAL